jgi:DNA-binding LacI/PurR family transcriptional regulator
MADESSTPKKKRGVTAADVARAAGVSSATVSRVLSGYEFVQEATRTRVLDAVERLGYVANLQARSLAGGSGCCLALPTSRSSSSTKATMPIRPR